ncbi:MAG: M20 metallopeptidase family protein [Acidimicrobiales bacterium]
MRSGGWCAEALHKEVMAILGDVVQLRRAVHAEPEVGLHLPLTQGKVLDALGKLDLQVRVGTGTSFVVATLQGRAGGGCVVLRADMDALGVAEQSGLPYSSTFEGRMHACGHDAHLAMLVGAAKVLAARRTAFDGSVVFFFEVGEEGCHGARVALEEGLLEEVPYPAAAFAVHVAPSLPAGMIATRPGTMMAASAIVRFVSRGAHAAFPHRSVDPVPAACQVVSTLPTLISREVDVASPAVSSVTSMETSSHRANVIPDEDRAIATLRTVSEGDAERLSARASEGVRVVGKAMGAPGDVEVTLAYPPTSNDPEVARLVLDVAGRLAGREAVLELAAPWATSEDFGYVLQSVPGALALLGVGTPGEEATELCSPRFRIDEDALATGIALHAAFALEVLGQ